MNLENIKLLVKNRKVSTDNVIFKLHSRLTVAMLVIFSVLLTSKQFFGEPIKCHAGGKELNAFMTHVCWIKTTFVHAKNLNEVNVDVKYLGSSAGREKVYLSYYQWVSVVLVTEALLCYLPHLLWKNWEKGTLNSLVGTLGQPLTSPQWTENHKKQLVYFILSNNYSHNIYFIKYIFCEFLNLTNVLLQIVFNSWLITGTLNIYKTTDSYIQNINSATPAFPMLSKCTLSHYGPSGTLMQRDALCLLALNILNDKIFLMLWIWLHFLAALSVILLLYRGICCLSPGFRKLLLKSKMSGLKFKKDCDDVIEELSFGKFFVLYKLEENLNPVVFEELVIELCEAIKIEKGRNF